MVHESDICIIGGGITSAMLALKLSELRPRASIVVVEAGRSIFDAQNRGRYRERAMQYGEHPWHDDYIEDQQARGIISMTMAVGGLALHWGGACNRFSAEDLRLKSMYGLAVDWPIEWTDLERYYCEAERRLHVAGEPSPYPGDQRSQPYPQGPIPLSYNLQILKQWAETSGLKFNSLPMARNMTPFDGRGACCVYDTCGDVCPSGARYSPDFTFKQLIGAGTEVASDLRPRPLTLHDQTLVRRLVLDERKPVVAVAQGFHQDRPGDPVEYRAKTFVIASGYCWSSHLLLLSSSPRFPNGLANSSGLVGRYMNGHKFMSATATIDAETFPGQNMTHSLISREYFRCRTDRPFVRHDTRVWESSSGRDPRLRAQDGTLLLGDEVMADWRSRTEGSSVRLRAYYDIHPSADSRLTLDAANKNRYGDPMPKIEHQLDAATQAREAATAEHVRGVFTTLAKASNGRIGNTSTGDYLDHPGGGCRMGTDRATSVCDSFGRTHDHENLFVVGAPTTPTGGCTNGTLTFVALTLRSADEIARALPNSR
ncbi:MAG TPA: GMC family oxidoreductase [Vicinamibacterales bacterium]|nr:GMC family oxidoreductase [Vicinamibacterales bacterium]